MNVIKIQYPEKLFFTSDSHFGHNAILKHADRPFSDIKTHDEGLIEKWNEIVPPDGIVVHQGDFAMKLKSSKLKWILETLNGTIYLVKGNHEQDIMKKSWAREYFENIQLRYDIEVMDKNGKFKTKNSVFNVIIADHFPLLSWNKKFHGSYHTFGHTHGNLKSHPDWNAYEVGVDVNDYRPISYYELMEIFNNKQLDKKKPD